MKINEVVIGKHKLIHVQGYGTIAPVSVRPYSDAQCYVTFFKLKPPAPGKDGTYLNTDMEVTVVEDAILEEKRIALFAEQLPNLLCHSFKVGSDPEVFVETADKNLLPAFSFLRSVKEPNFTDIVDTNIPNTHGPTGQKPIYWDGFQAEFQTLASECLAWQVDSTQLGLKAALNYARKIDKGARLSSKTVFDIPMKLLSNSLEEHVSLGCMPSFNAYGLEGQRVPPRELPFRSAGGHIHLGIGSRPKEEMERIVKAMDMVLGVACVSLFAGMDDPRRRHFYGLPGEYRLPPHGLEYRTLSNAWLCHPLIMNMVFELARKAVVFGEKALTSMWQVEEKETLDCILTCNVDKAREILTTNKTVFCKILEAANLYPTDKAYNIFMNGVASAVDDYTDMETNWNLNGKWVTHSDGDGKSWRHSKFRRTG